LLRAITFDESLPCAHLSGFLYSSITFAFLLVIVSFGTLVHETNWKIFFKTFFFKKKKTKQKKRNLSHSEGQDQDQPLGAKSSGPVGKPRQTRGQQTKHRFWPFIWKARDGARLTPSTKLRGNRDTAQVQRPSIRAFPAVTCACLPAAGGNAGSSTQRLARLPQHAHRCCPPRSRTLSSPHAPVPAQTPSRSATRSAQTYSYRS